MFVYKKTTSTLKLSGHTKSRLDLDIKKLRWKKEWEAIFIKISTTDHYQNLLKRLCKSNDISSRKVRFENVEDVVIIHVKNHLKEGVDLESFKILNLVLQTVVPLGIKFNQQLYLYPGGNRLDRVAITFKKNDYVLLNKKLEEGDF